MTAAVRQEATQNWSSASVTSVTSTAFASACQVGSLIEAWIIWNTATTQPSSVVDSAGQSYTFRSSVFDNNDGITVALYTFANNQSATALTVTATWASAKAYCAAWTKEITGVTTSPFQTAAGQDQASPGTGTGVISSGNVTPTSQPCLLSALSWDDGGGATSVVAGSLTSGISGWLLTGGGGAATTISASQHLTSTAPIAATFTNTTDGGTRRFITIAAVYTEASVVYTPFSRTQFFVTDQVIQF